MSRIDDARSTPDQVLVQRALSEDGEAFGELYRRHVRKILRFHHRRCGDAHDALDMTSETFASALVSLDRFDPSRAEFVQWLHGIARNVWRRHVRDGQATTTSRDRLHLAELTVTRDDLDHVDSIVDAGRFAAELATRLDALSPRLRVVVQLRVLDGLDAATTAERLGLPQTTVRKRLERALRQLGTGAEGWR